MPSGLTPSSRFTLPLWARWVLSLGVGAALLVALIVFVSHNNNNAEATQSPAAVKRAYREAQVVVGQDQAAQAAALAAGVSPRHGIVAAVRHRMQRLIATGAIEGTLQRVSCTRTGGTSARRAFRCTAEASDVNYPFLGVVDVPVRTITYCKRDLPPVPSMNIPVSPRCTA